MSDKTEESALCALTANRPVVIAECIDGLGCAVYADGSEITAPWASQRVGKIVGMFIKNGAVIGPQLCPKYFVLRRESSTDAFELLGGPLTADELLASVTAR